MRLGLRLARAGVEDLVSRRSETASTNRFLGRKAGATVFGTSETVDAAGEGSQTTDPHETNEHEEQSGLVLGWVRPSRRRALMADTGRGASCEPFPIRTEIV